MRLNSSDSDALIQLAVSRWRLKEGYEAQAALVRALSQNSLKPEEEAVARRTLAEIYDDWDVLKVMQQRNDHAAQERFHTHQIDKNPDSAAMSYALRGFARHWLERPEEARKDFEKALALGGLSDDLSAGVKSSLNEIARAEDAQRRAIEEQAAAEEEARLRAAEEKAAIEAAAAAAAAIPQVNAYDYFDRMDQLLAHGDLKQAADLLQEIQKLDLADSEEKGTRLYYEAELAWRKGSFGQAAKGYEQAAKLIRERFRRAAALMRLAEYEARRGKGKAAESYAVKSADLLLDQPWKFKQVAGFFMGLGNNAKAASYYRKALKLDSSPGNNLDTFAGLAEIYKLTGDEAKYHQFAQKYLDAADSKKGRLPAAEKGRFYFYRAELSAGQDRAGAYRDYEQASRLLGEKFRLSEIYMKMADYLADIKDYDQAAHYAALSAQTLPDQPWRNRQVAALFERIGRLDKAIIYTKTAMSQEPDKDPRADRDLAFLYLRNKDKANYLASHADYIDKLTAETERLGGRAGKELKKELYEARQLHADTSRTWGFDSYNFGTRRKNGDYAIMTINELFVNFTLPTDTPGKVYHRLNATPTSRYSGVYSDPITSQERSWRSRTNFSDSVYGIIGAKVSPFSKLPDLSLGVEYLYPIGRDQDHDDFRGRLEYNQTWGEKPRPFESNWNYAKTYGELLYSTRHNDFTAFGEFGLGRTFSPEFDKNFLIIPHLRANWSYSGEEVSKGGRWGLEAGPALSFRKWFNEDRYNAPRSYVELGIQYTIGLSHKLDNGVGFNLNFSF